MIEYKLKLTENEAQLLAEISRRTNCDERYLLSSYIEDGLHNDFERLEQFAYWDVDNGI